MKMNIYLKKSLFFAFITGLLCFSACNDLDETVYSAETADNFFQNADQVMAAYVQPYSFMQTHVYQTHFALAEFSTDEAVVPVRYGYVDQEGAWIRFHRHTWTSSDFWILLEWQNLFQAIGYCNYFINNVEDRDLSGMELPISKEQMIAEVKMVRALHYYWALSHFGNIPVVEEISTVSPPTTPSAEVFVFIENEIKENIPLLSEKGDAGWYGHFTKSAAQAFLAKLYLNAEVFTGQERLEDCVTACNAIINSENYSLDEEWSDPFVINNEWSNENIFVVPFDASNAQQFNFLEQNFHENILLYKYGVDFYAWHKISTQESFYNLYQPNDQRINQWTVGEQTYIDDEGNEQPIPDWSDEPMYVTPEIDMLINNEGGESQGAMNKKYEIQEGGLSNMNNDMVIFRLADILLMKAECLMRGSGDAATPETVDLVNEVRARSFEPGDPDAAYTMATLTMDELLNERGRELAYEMHRREDLIRFNKFNEPWWEKDQSAEFRQLYPIPFNVLTANPALEQNPGYNEQ